MLPCWRELCWLISLETPVSTSHISEFRAWDLLGDLEIRHRTSAFNSQASQPRNKRKRGHVKGVIVIAPAWMLLLPFFPKPQPRDLCTLRPMQQSQLLECIWGFKPQFSELLCRNRRLQGSKASTCPSLRGTRQMPMPSHAL